MLRFALLSGARLGNVIGLTWSQVDFDAETSRGGPKSKRPGGRRQVLPLTPALTAIVSGERGRRPALACSRTLLPAIAMIGTAA